MRHQRIYQDVWSLPLGGCLGKNLVTSAFNSSNNKTISSRFIIIASYTANLAAFLTVSRLDVPVESLDDLSKQYKILYAPLNDSSAMTYFQRMSDIEGRFYEIWKDMSLNDSLSPVERSKLAVWDYPVSDKYTKMWQAMQEAGLPNTIEEAVERVRNSTSATGKIFANFPKHF